MKRHALFALVTATCCLSSCEGALSQTDGGLPSLQLFQRVSVSDEDRETGVADIKNATSTKNTVIGANCDTAQLYPATPGDPNYLGPGANYNCTFAFAMGADAATGGFSMVGTDILTTFNFRSNHTPDDNGVMVQYLTGINDFYEQMTVEENVGGFCGHSIAFMSDTECIEKDMVGNAGRPLAPIVYALANKVAYLYVNDGHYFSAIGATTPVKWLDVTSTGTGEASVTLGDTNSSSATKLQSGTVIANANPVRLPNYTISGLPPCNATYQYSEALVTNGVESPSYLSTVSATGSTVVRVLCNGSNWVYD